MNNLLQKALELQNNGQIEQAKHIYLEILEIQPKDAAANHALGLMEINLNGALAALPRLEIAVMEKPEIEQYWVSYIGALMQSGPADSVADAFELGLKYGLSNEVAQALAADFVTILESKMASRQDLTSAPAIGIHIHQIYDSEQTQRDNEKERTACRIKTFCVAHKALELPLPDDVPVIWLGSAPVQTHGKHVVYHGSEISEEFDAWHAFLGGSSGSFVIEKILRDGLIEWNPDDRISIIQYRKFMAITPNGVNAKNYPGMHLVSPSEAIKLDLHAIQDAVVTPYLVPQPFKLGSLYEQYGLSHHISDLLRYMAVAVDLKIISGKESYEFLNLQYLIPGGIEFGIYPIGFFMDTISSLRTVSMRFLHAHKPTSMNPYQRRAVSFCNERLGSYLLQKELVNIYGNEIPKELFGYMHTVAKGDMYCGSSK